MTPLITEMVRLTPEPELYHWFDFGAIGPDQVVNLDVVNDTPLPFDSCAVTGMDGGVKWCLLLRQKADVLTYTGRSFDRGIQLAHPSFTVRRVPDEGLRLYPLAGEGQADVDVCRGLLATVGAWLQSLTPDTEANIPKATPSLINSKRAAKGKGPIVFDWHTVIIGPRTARAAPKGGTHASPRAHDRRGHWRTYASGKRVWVKDCKVGSASRGVVFKDYRVAA